ncbi:putative transcriptional regulator containing an HTH domain and an uncharacterized domain shared with the mammalian protein Schlafen [Candidatus Zixiibacteriota bacterium]|nr:putative transcriptional regulator containing an HTH domain and an uncharacterized domain shared with the mammalian protein Schlafen [candidate division Zixibacteria bacterium]
MNPSAGTPDGAKKRCMENDNLQIDKYFREVEELVKNDTPESYLLEYKRELNIEADKEKKEFLADISAFANKFGGRIIFGVQEKRDKEGKSTGRPEKIVGIGSINEDELKSKIESILDTGIQPKITQKQVHIVRSGDVSIVIIDIARSLYGPHCIWFKQSGRFYKRTSVGKIQMDVIELREAFMQANEWKKQADNFRDDRFEEILSELSEDVKNAEAIFVLHIVPLGVARESIDFKLIQKYAVEIFSRYFGMYNFRNTLDGFIVCKLGQKGILFLRNGALEGFQQLPLNPKKCEDIKFLLLDGHYIENLIDELLKKYIDFARITKIQPPIALYLSMMVPDDCILDISGKGNGIDFIDEFREKQFDRRKLKFGGIVIDNYDIDTKKNLCGLYDILWQSGGWPERPYKN